MKVVRLSKPDESIHLKDLNLKLALDMQIHWADSDRCLQTM